MRRQTGVAAVEVAMLAGLFFALLVGVLEAARLMYLYNSGQEATRHAAAAAALVSHRDAAGLARIRQDAVLRRSPGPLVFGEPVTDASVRIDYLALVRDAAGGLRMTPIPDAALPLCPRENRRVCTNHPNASNCIRFVRARICAAGADCRNLQYRPLFGLLPFTPELPHATTIAVAESLGSMPEGTPCL